MSWDYPQKGSLHNLIHLSGFYPLTSITSLSKTEKQCLLAKGSVLSRELLQHPKAMVQPQKV